MIIEPNSKFSLEIEEELKVAQVLINRIRDAVFCVGKSGQFLYVNNSTCSLFGYSREEMLSMTLQQVDSNWEQQKWLEQWELLKQQDSISFKTDYLSKQGGVVTVQVTFVLEDKIGCLVCYAYACNLNNELQEFKQTESELSQTLEATKRLSELRQHFISMLCHELSTSLNIISFSSDLLKRNIYKLSKEKNRSYIDMIQNAVEQMSKLLDEIILLNQAESDKLKCEPKQLDLRDFCQNIVAHINLVGDNQKEIKFISKGEFNQRNVDPKLLKYILTNLLSNAVKYDQSGESIILELICQEDNVTFKVKDRGIGIRAIEQQKIFEPFYRGSNVDDIPGTGLGLSIVKTLADLHGCEIHLSSEVGLGTVFTVVFTANKV